jgi:antitoxin (DNA-binding transcriptional repressor) of toxin-antitoxin stability system
MRTVTPLDLRRSLGAILDEASAGQRFLIERDHRPVAILVSVEDGRRLDDPDERRRRSLAALDRLVAIGEARRPGSPGGADAADAADAVRRDRDRDDR